MDLSNLPEKVLEDQSISSSKKAEVKKTKKQTSTI